MNSQDLLNNLFKHPYTKIEFIMDDLQVSRVTATNYLDKLVELGFLEKLKKAEATTIRRVKRAIEVLNESTEDEN